MPWFPEAFCSWLHTKIFICDWRDVECNFTLLRNYLKYQVERSLLPSVQPFHAFVYPLAPEDKLLLAQMYAGQARPQYHAQPRSGKIRIGYISYDFANHPLCYLMRSVFRMHDRDKFIVFCFALSADDGSIFRQEISREADFLIELSGVQDDCTAAQLVYSYNIDVLFNLSGYTKGARNGIFALEPGKVQVNLLGYPGTMGAAYIPYIVGDKTVIPAECVKYYSEKVIYMPHTYFVNDYLQSAQFIFTQEKPTRQSLGLPADKFIFANFNQLYKLDVETFGLWLDILRRTPHSVLWLLRFPSAAEEQLVNYAKSKDFDHSRLFFTEVAPREQHLLRAPLADLFLDTPVCNGHTTCCDVLWSGLPVLTLPLKDFASRVAASLCTALQCPEMVASSPADYEEKAVKWALAPAELGKLRAKIAEKRLTAPLFSTQLWVRHLEQGIEKVVEIYENGEAPRSVEITH